MKLDQKGVTLIELIVALAMVSVLAGIGWTALSIGSQHGALETSKTKLQQNTNIVVTTLVNEHRRSDAYYIKFQNNQIELKTCKNAVCEPFKKITDSAYIYSGTINGTDISAWNENTKLEPEKAHVKILLTVTDSKNIKNSYTVSTTLTRILTSQN